MTVTKEVGEMTRTPTQQRNPSEACVVPVPRAPIIAGVASATRAQLDTTHAGVPGSPPFT